MVEHLFSHAVDISNYFFGILSFLLVLILMLARNKSARIYIVMVIYACYGIIILSFPAELTGAMSRYPCLIGLSWPFYSLIAGAFYLYIKTLVNPTYSFLRRDLLFFLPGILYAAVLTPFVYLAPVEDKIRMITQYEEFDIITLINLVFFNITVLFFIVLSFYEIRILFNRERIMKLVTFRIVFFLLVITTAGVVMNCIALVVGSGLLMRIDSVLYNAVLFTPFLLSNRYPNFFHDFAVDVSKEKYRQSRCKGIDVKSIILRIEELIEIEKIHLRPELTVNSMSTELNISTHQLSEIFNKELHTNFLTFVNRHRIEEAKSLLRTRPNDTVLNIAYTVGFNSKTAFYTAFTKETSLPPNEFRKQPSKK